MLDSYISIWIKTRNKFQLLSVANEWNETKYSEEHFLKICDIFFTHEWKYIFAYMFVFFVYPKKKGWENIEKRDIICPGATTRCSWWQSVSGCNRQMVWGYWMKRRWGPGLIRGAAKRLMHFAPCRLPLSIAHSRLFEKFYICNFFIVRGNRRWRQYKWCARRRKCFKNLSSVHRGWTGIGRFVSTAIDNF